MKEYVSLEVKIVYLLDDVVKTSAEFNEGTSSETPELGSNEMPFLPFD